jgi:hypothetical protein
MLARVLSDLFNQQTIIFVTPMQQFSGGGMLLPFSTWPLF